MTLPKFFYTKQEWADLLLYKSRLKKQIQQIEKQL